MPRKTNLREQLIATAAGMIASQGTAGLTVRAIAKQAGVADGVLYNHFSDKEELLAQSLITHVRNVEATLGELPEAGSGKVEANLKAHLEYGLALHKAILPAFTGLIGQPAVLERLGELENDSWRERFTAYLHAERELGRLRADADVDSAVALIVGICHETVLSGLLPHNPVTRDPDTDRIVAAVLTGIR
ncbi:TetR/AcrR family transcriptional regulator [Kibdelosporangium philippinense]|uniref:TetR/AcrR family transcriptional regulator n=1 Tax=Kibdelosporangium philippinense TaxID=211113 RepID=A0ABS8ZXM9_9PSEU|nr:TetR/AcrR family transcriptional regulator [Kibdelosporangium philippinense]MCE7012148.1 TetR/AcrR family transcriptional regulator [Kibdelosporangium philippinense]